jgi:hypothetical protein
MKNLIRVLLMLAFMLPIIDCIAQPEIVTIDGIYIERDTLDGKKKLTTRQFRLNEEAIIDGDVIAFDIPGFGEYLEEIKVSMSDIVLLIEDISITEIPAYIENAESGIVRFEFTDEDLTVEHRQLLYNRKGGAVKKLRLGIKAGENIMLYYSPKAHFYFESMKNWEKIGLFMIVGFVLLFAALIISFPTILKESIPAGLRSAFNSIASPASDADSPKPTSIFAGLQKNIQSKLAYSFSKSQLVFWTLIILSSFVYIWALTDDFNPINTTALILLGISSATSAAGSIINDRQEVAATSTPETEVTVTTPTTEVVTTRTEIPQVQSVVAFLESRLTNNGFFKDILSDNEGISIHRVQSFGFNIIYGIIFLKSVVLDYTMPTFGEVELLLLGISNGTYAFLKSSETK